MANPPDEVLTPFRTEIRPPAGVQGQVSILFAHAQWHLEAWYFADAGNLREYLGRAPGNVDTSRPDQIENPKNHLRDLFGDRVCTAQVSEEIARQLNPETIAQRSPSFSGFLEAVINVEGPIPRLNDPFNDPSPQPKRAGRKSPPVGLQAFRCPAAGYSPKYQRLAKRCLSKRGSSNPRSLGLTP